MSVGTSSREQEMGGWLDEGQVGSWRVSDERYYCLFIGSWGGIEGKTMKMQKREERIPRGQSLGGWERLASCVQGEGVSQMGAGTVPPRTGENDGSVKQCGVLF